MDVTSLPHEAASAVPGFDAMLRSAGVVPERTGDPARAGALLREFGAAILTGRATEPQAVIAAGEAVLGPRLWGRWDPRSFRAHDRPGRKRQIIKETRTILEATAPAGAALPVEGSRMAMEGWGLGEGLPDMVAYLAAAEPELGGDFFAVDGKALLDALPAQPGGEALWRRVWGAPVLLKTHVKHPPERACLARRTRGGRVVVRYLPGALVGDEPWARDWHALAERAAAAAPRFELCRGEVLLLDNYRLWCGREPYRGPRLLHRGWFWSAEVMAYPMVTEWWE